MSANMTSQEKYRQKTPNKGVAKETVAPEPDRPRHLVPLPT